jgi:hypothetical protein
MAHFERAEQRIVQNLRMLQAEDRDWSASALWHFRISIASNLEQSPYFGIWKVVSDEFLTKSRDGTWFYGGGWPTGAASNTPTVWSSDRKLFAAHGLDAAKNSPCRNAVASRSIVAMRAGNAPTRFANGRARQRSKPWLPTWLPPNFAISWRGKSSAFYEQGEYFRHCARQQISNPKPNWASSRAGSRRKAMKAPNKPRVRKRRGIRDTNYAFRMESEQAMPSVDAGAQ